MENFSQILWRSRVETPDQVAVYLLDRSQNESAVTYRSLLDNAAGYAQALAAAGVQPGEVVILILDHGVDLVAAFFGTVLRGAVPAIMPFLTEKLSPDHYRKTLRSLFEITAPGAVLTTTGFLSEVQAARQVQGNAPRSILVAGEISPLHGQADGEQIQAVLAGLKRSPEEIVLLQHSSGTTGLQKGVALSHRAVIHQLESYSRAIGLQAQDVVVSWLPLYHDMGLIAGFILPILRGVPLVLMSPFDWVRAPYKLLQAVSRYQGTLTWLPNFAYNFCAQKIRDRDLQGVDLSSWRAVINCSEPMYWKSQQLFLERFAPYGLRAEALATCYAMAENVFAVTQGGVRSPVRVDQIDPQGLLTRKIAQPAGDSHHALRLLSAGGPIENTCLRILDGERAELPERCVGEIAIKSDCMLSGYYHRPDLSAQLFLDGWYLTGDLGYLAEGELYITGRKKDLIIVGGKNIYPQDLERLTNETPGVHPGRAVAFGVFNEQTGTEDIVIVAEGEAETGKTPEDLANEIRRRVTQGSDIALRYVYIVAKNWLLKTSSGKIARTANREKYLAEVSWGKK